MKNELDIVSRESNAVTKPAPTVADMLQAVIDGGVNKENVEALGKLTELYERMEARNAEKEFASAFVALQADTPSIKAMKPVPNKDGSVRYTFAPFEEIMAQVSPILRKHGFTVTFSTDFRESRLIKTCTLQHTSGHSRSNTFAVRIGGGPPGSTETQADGAASTYAKRFALCDALNIVIDKDVDAKAEGRPITPEQAQELQVWVEEVGADKEKFLKYAGAKTYGEIMSNRYDDLCEMLRKKEKK